MKENYTLLQTLGKFFIKNENFYIKSEKTKLFKNDRFKINLPIFEHHNFLTQHSPRLN